MPATRGGRGEGREGGVAPTVTSQCWAEPGLRQRCCYCPPHTTPHTSHETAIFPPSPVNTETQQDSSRRGGERTDQQRRERSEQRCGGAPASWSNTTSEAVTGWASYNRPPPASQTVWRCLPHQPYQDRERERERERERGTRRLCRLQSRVKTKWKLPRVPRPSENRTDWDSRQNERDPAPVPPPPVRPSQVSRGGGGRSYPVSLCTD